MFACGPVALHVLSRICLEFGCMFGPFCIRDCDSPSSLRLAGPWGGTAVDAMFLQLFKELLGSSNYDCLAPSARNELLATWEDIKTKWTNDGGVSIPTKAITDGLSEEVEARPADILRRGAQNYNITHGLSEDACVVVNKQGTSIKLPQDVVRGLFGECARVRVRECVFANSCICKRTSAGMYT